MAPLGIWPRKDPLHLDSVDMAAGEHRQEPFLPLNPRQGALWSTRAPGSADSGPAAPFEKRRILLYLPTATAYEFSSPAQRPEAEEWCCFANAPFATALFRRSRARRSFHG